VPKHFFDSPPRIGRFIQFFVPEVLDHVSEFPPRVVVFLGYSFGAFTGELATHARKRKCISVTMSAAEICT
jgi:hypothetical protein